MERGEETAEEEADGGWRRMRCVGVKGHNELVKGCRDGRRRRVER